MALAREAEAPEVLAALALAPIASFDLVCTPLSFLCAVAAANSHANKYDCSPVLTRAAPPSVTTRKANKVGKDAAKQAAAPKEQEALLGAYTANGRAAKLEAWRLKRQRNFAYVLQHGHGFKYEVRTKGSQSKARGYRGRFSRKASATATTEPPSRRAKAS